MRDRLAERAGRRLPYVARLKLYGVHHLLVDGVRQRRRRRGTALLTWVHDYDPEADRRGEFLTGHVWVPDAGPFVLAGVGRGQAVSFTAVAAPYVRGQHGSEQEEDYQLDSVLNVVILTTSIQQMNAPTRGNTRDGGQRDDGPDQK